MCLISFAYNVHDSYPLIVVANRDEFYERPTASAHFWADAANILAGRDLVQGGSWLGISKQGRFAAITNYRDPKLSETGTSSRGEIVQQFLLSTLSGDDFITQLREKKADYAGFNALLFDGHVMHHYNNIFDEHNVIPNGVHSLTNGTLNSDWPKAQLANEKLHAVLQKNEQPNAKNLISLLDDETIAPDEKLPQTGVGIHLERILSAQFIKLPNYGTRCSTAVVFEKSGRIQFIERTFENGKMQFDKTFVVDKYLD